MSKSGIITTAYIDPFYQNFLKEMFDQRNSAVIEFPKNHILQKSLVLLLKPHPEIPEFPDNYNKAWKCAISVPYSQEKDPYYFNYISKRGNNLLSSKIRDFYMIIAHDEMIKYRNQGYEHKDVVVLFMDQYNIDMKYYDRVLKDWQRFRNKFRQKKYRKKQHKSSNFSA